MISVKQALAMTLATAVISFGGTAVSMAGTWVQNGGNWYYTQDDGSYAKGWQWIDAGNGTGKSYYFDATGKMAVNTVVEGYTVNASGAWIQNGQEVTKPSMNKAVHVVSKFLEVGSSVEDIQQTVASGVNTITAGTSVGPVDGTVQQQQQQMAVPTSPIVEIAKQYIGPLPYILGGNSLTTGTDCSGFTRMIFELAGKKLPRTAAQQFAAAPYHPTEAELQPGDLVFYGNGKITHVVIYAGDGIIHQTNSQRNCVAYDRGSAEYDVLHFQNIIGFGRY